MSLFDSHSHLIDEKLYTDYENYFNLFLLNGGKGLINVGVDPSWNRKVIDLTQRLRSCAIDEEKYFGCTIGYDPYQVYSQKIHESEFNYFIDDLKNLYLSNIDLIKGIGESGIDLYYGKRSDSLLLQSKMFDLQCNLASELDLPLVIHSRNAFDETLGIVQKYKNLKIYFHCRGYGAKEIRIIDNSLTNYFVGFAGNFTFPKAEDLRESIKIIDRSRIVLETDSPYLAPQQVRGQLNHPANIIYTYEYVSELLKIEKEELEEIVERNFFDLFTF